MRQSESRNYRTCHALILERLTPGSGRPGFVTTRALAAQGDPEGLHCFQNGASVVDFGSGRSLSTPMPSETVETLIARGRATGRALELYTDDDYATESDSERLRRHAALLGVRFEPRPFETLAGHVVRAQWLVPHAELGDVLVEPSPGLEVSPSLAPSMPDTTFISLTRSGVNKGRAVGEIAAAYAIPLENVMYVGDGFKDAPAMRVVGWPVAVVHAKEAARELDRTCT